MKAKIIYLACTIIAFASCANKNKEYDATGTFEATETVVSAEQNGKLLKFDVTEGTEVADGQEIGIIDTTQIWLKIEQLNATKSVYESQKPDAEKQIAVIKQQLIKAQREQQRYRELVADGAAPSKTLDDATNLVIELRKQLTAQESALSTNINALDKQIATTNVQVSQLKDQLKKCHITSPVTGVVLEKYTEQGEYAAIGKPLFKIAGTGKMYLRAYVTSAQLQNVKVGQKVTVFADYGDKQKKQYEGTVEWISDKSEFTPKTILTDNERADLVYAVKIAVKNDGYVKIGMYGEVKF